MSYSDYMPDDGPDVSDVSDTLNWTGKDQWNAIYTVQLGELIQYGIFDWANAELDWSSAAYTPEQYRRVCDYFIERYRYREISIVPYLEWAQMLHRKLIYELMPKYKRMYALLDDDFDLAQDSSYKAKSASSGNSDSYRKRRSIGSDYPETLLSGNSDYLSNGQDEESEDVGENNAKADSSQVVRKNLLDAYLDYEERYMSIDQSLVNELESMFIGLYTVAIDGM